MLTVGREARSDGKVWIPLKPLILYSNLRGYEDRSLEMFIAYVMMCVSDSRNKFFLGLIFNVQSHQLSLTPHFPCRWNLYPLSETTETFPFSTHC